MDTNYIDLDSADHEKKKFSKKKIIIIAAVTVVIAIAIIAIVTVLLLRNKAPEDQTFLFINDLHIDPQYNERSLAAENNLCRITSPNSTVNRPFGQYGCDTPKAVFDSMMKYLPKEIPDTSFIILGGDMIGHGLKLEPEGVISNMKMICDKLQEVYKDKPIFVTLGNNDYYKNYGSWDTDSGDFERISTVFGKWMTAESLATFKKGGYYLHDVEHIKTRLFFLNSVILSKKRPLNGTDDPYDQFKWLDEKSTEAEKKGFKIALIMHIPPGVSSVILGDGWNPVYMNQLQKFLAKHETSFMISAHNHIDLLLNLYNSKSESLYCQSSPSISSAHNNNPAFRLYSYDQKQLIDYKQYYADIMLNPQDDLKWELEYSFKNTYANSPTNEGINNAVKWIKSTGQGKWRYKEYIFSRADEYNSVYYCLLQSVTSEEAKKCVSGLNKKLLVPYGRYDSD